MTTNTNRTLLYVLLVVLLAGLIVAVGWAGYSLLSLAFSPTPTPTLTPAVVTVVVVATPTLSVEPATATPIPPGNGATPSVTTTAMPAIFCNVSFSPSRMKENRAVNIGIAFENTFVFVIPMCLTE